MERDREKCSYYQVYTLTCFQAGQERGMTVEFCLNFPCCLLLCRSRSSASSAVSSSSPPQRIQIPNEMFYV